MPIGRRRRCGRPPAFPPMPHCRRTSSTSSHATRMNCSEKINKEKKDGSSDQQPKTKDAMMSKATNDAVALIRSLAELRGRNADWAEKAVREAASLSANAALQANVIDLVARDQDELL